LVPFGQRREHPVVGGQFLVGAAGSAAIGAAGVAGVAAGPLRDQGQDDNDHRSLDGGPGDRPAQTLVGGQVGNPGQAQALVEVGRPRKNEWNGNGTNSIPNVARNGRRRGAGSIPMINQ
jgi:hypothetical protein